MVRFAGDRGRVTSAALLWLFCFCARLSTLSPLMLVCSVLFSASWRCVSASSFFLASGLSLELNSGTW